MAATIAPETIGKTRKPNGTFAPADHVAGITVVFIPGMWRIGYRVGPGGRIYADLEAAKRYAQRRANWCGE